MFKIPQSELLKVSNIQLSKVEEAASLCFLRKERFVEGFSCQEELIKLLNEFFGNLGVLYSEGLVTQFKKLKQKVVKNTLIGLILVGVNRDTFINKYTQQDNVTIIDITISSICRTLIREHFTEQEIINICLSTPNFQIYYIKEDEEIERLIKNRNKQTDNNDSDKFNDKYNERGNSNIVNLSREARNDLDSIMHF